MSIDIDWASLTTGTEGLALAETIRLFVDNKFQQIHLPGFIRSVRVHSFDFGQECPVVELKDISDPLPEFYDDGSDSGEDDEVDDAEPAIEPLRHTQGLNGHTQNGALPAQRPTYIDTRTQGLRPSGLAETVASSFLPRVGTPGMPGGTSNLSYFQLPLSAGLSGSRTPLATVAGGGAFTAWPDHHFPMPATFSRPQSPDRQASFDADPSSRPSTSYSHRRSSRSTILPEDATSLKHDISASSPSTPSPLDTQITMHITYTGSISLSITASLLLDYPMSSFASIPLKLSITGLSFDGVALLAYLRKRAHFCFLGAEDAQVLVGAEARHDSASAAETTRGRDKLGGLIKEIRVESEIGKREGGKQSLKNVGKVEKFVVEQVRRIFEEEFVWPSWWTFLV